MPLPSEDRPIAGFRRLAAVSALATFLLILVGGVVRVSDSGLGCGPAGSGTEGWPLCGGRIVPFIDTHAVVEYTHRLLAAVVSLAILALVWYAYRRLRGNAFLMRGSAAAAVLVLAQAGLGGLTVENNLHDVLVAAHLGLAMLLLALLLALRHRAAAASPPPAEAPRTLRPLATVACVLALATIVSGGYMAGTQRYGTTDYELGDGAHLACGKEFPTCNGEVLPFGQARLVDIHLTHRVLMGLTTLAVLALALLAGRRRIRRLPWAAAAAVLPAQVLLGAMNVWLGEHEVLIVAHLALATLLWASLVSARLELAGAPARAVSALAHAKPTSSAAVA
jgi:heme A synthase